jgi:hypothetical protein
VATFGELPSGQMVEVLVHQDKEIACGVGVVPPGGELLLSLDLEALPPRPVVGLRFRAVPEGARVTWIHERGPAVGLLEIGDVMLAIEGEPLAGLSTREIGPMLTLGVGDGRRVLIRRGGAESVVELVAVGVDSLGGGGAPGGVNIQPVARP